MYVWLHKHAFLNTVIEFFCVIHLCGPGCLNVGKNNLWLQPLIATTSTSKLCYHLHQQHCYQLHQQAVLPPPPASCTTTSTSNWPCPMCWSGWWEVNYCWYQVLINFQLNIHWLKWTIQKIKFSDIEIFSQFIHGGETMLIIKHIFNHSSYLKIEVWNFAWFSELLTYPNYLWLILDLEYVSVDIQITRNLYV